MGTCVCACASSRARIAARARVIQRHLRQRRNGGVIVDHSTLRHVAAMAVIGGTAQAHIRPHQKVRAGFLDRRDGGRGEATLIESIARASILAIGRGEQQHRWHAGRAGGTRLLHRLIHRKLCNARHARDRMAHGAPRHDEQRIDERIGGQARFAHQAAPGSVRARASRSHLRKSHRHQALVCNNRNVVSARSCSVAESATTALWPRALTSAAVVRPIATAAASASSR